MIDLTQVFIVIFLYTLLYLVHTSWGYVNNSKKATPQPEQRDRSTDEIIKDKLDEIIKNRSMVEIKNRSMVEIIKDTSDRCLPIKINRVITESEATKMI